MISDELLASAAGGDLETLCQLDERGLLLGANEAPGQYAERLKTLRKNIEAMDSSLKASGKYETEGLLVRGRDRIPEKIFEEAAWTNGALYGFRIDWVPGFFIDPSFSFLFGGCALYFYPDFFAVFMIRRSFRNKQRWLIYSRKELLAHELCHIARIALESNDFEETFAYQTASSGFRRLMGGLFLHQNDSFAFLGAALLLLAVQALRTCLFPSLPIAPFWALPVLVTGWLGIRYWRLRRILYRAGKALACFGGDFSKVLFRCTDDEIRELAAAQDADAWLAMKKQASFRWKVIFRRFYPGK